MIKFPLYEVVNKRTTKNTDCYIKVNTNKSIAIKHSYCVAMFFMLLCVAFALRSVRRAHYCLHIPIKQSSSTRGWV